MSIEIVAPGIMTTVQDAGCIGYQRFGVNPSGVMDTRSYTLANLLVGNPTGQAVLEATIIGPTIRFNESTVIAVTGGNLRPQLNGAQLPMYEAVAVREGDVLSFLGKETGARAYIAFAGGIDVPKVMGSRSTQMKSKLGGLDGRALKAGDRLKLIAPDKPLANLVSRKLPVENFSQCSEEITIRVLKGMQFEAFTQAGRDTFFQATYTLGVLFDRQGYRLDGPAIEHLDGAGIVSDCCAFGSIQVPGDGKPIILMADHQTTGGYTKIATVISVDLPVLAQCISGCRIKFQLVSIEEAQALYCQQQKQYRALAKQLDVPVQPDRKPPS